MSAIIETRGLVMQFPSTRALDVLDQPAGDKTAQRAAGTDGNCRQRRFLATPASHGEGRLERQAVEAERRAVRNRSSERPGQIGRDGPAWRVVVGEVRWPSESNDAGIEHEGDGATRMAVAGGGEMDPAVKVQLEHLRSLGYLGAGN